MSITGTGYVKRELFKVFMDVGESSTAEWEVIGDKKIGRASCRERV